MPYLYPYTHSLLNTYRSLRFYLFRFPFFSPLSFPSLDRFNSLFSSFPFSSLLLSVVVHSSVQRLSYGIFRGPFRTFIIESSKFQSCETFPFDAFNSTNVRFSILPTAFRSFALPFIFPFANLL